MVKPSNGWTLEIARARVAKAAGTTAAGKKIVVTPGGGCGIGTFGAIDYLCKKHGFSYEMQKVKSK